MTENAELLLDGNRGIYIPQQFAQHYSQYITNKDELAESLNDLLEGPENELYWESWEDVLDNAKLKDYKDRDCILYQDQDLWLIPETELEQIPEG